MSAHAGRESGVRVSAGSYSLPTCAARARRNPARVPRRDMLRVAPSEAGGLGARAGDALHCGDGGGQDNL